MQFERRTFASAARRSLHIWSWLLFLAIVSSLDAPGFRIINIEPLGTNTFRLHWETTPGKEYEVQRSSNLLNSTNASWLPVLTLRATGAVSFIVDAVGPGVGQRFYRVLQRADQESLTVSPVDISLNASNGRPDALLRVVTGGTQTVSSVAFFDQGTLLGFGTPGLDSSWSFPLPANSLTPQIRRITARVITEEGTTNETAATGILQMDPSRLVPLDGGGVPRYGQFVTVDATDRMDPCRFYPEGLGGAATLTGAHFEFPDGGFFNGQNGGPGIDFTFGQFFRAAVDTAPLTVGLGSHSLDFDDVTPSAVVGALGLPAGSTVDLLWNGLPLQWLEGAMDVKGWAALKVRPPIGDFLLPNSQECALVSFDAGSGDPTLIICFHGEWAPFSDGPLFRIPKSEPLKIYISLSGQIVAHGTVEALFDGGATLRGSVSWREPFFEVRLQGRNIVIPALASLKRALPTAPEQCVPAGNGAAELDAAAKCLTSFRDTYRALAMGGLAESSLEGGASFAPLGEPTDPSATALGAWAARLASWTTDRAGQTLDEEMLADLQKVVLNAAKTGESALDLPTALKMLRDVLVLQQNRDVPLGAGASAEGLRTQIQDAEDRLFASAERIVSETPNFEASPQFTEIVNLFRSAIAIQGAAPDGRKGNGAASKSVTRLRDLIDQAKGKIGPNFALRVSQAALNQGFGGLSARALLKFLEEMAVYRELLLDSGGTAPPGAPTLTQIVQAAQNLRPHFASVAAGNSVDYFKVRDAVKERTQFFVLNDRLGLKMFSDEGSFFFPTKALIESLSFTFQSLPLADKARACRDLEFSSSIIQHTGDNGSRVAISEAQALVQNCNTLTADALASSSQDTRCDDLAQALLTAGFTIAPREPSQEGTAFPDITGLYESAEDGTESYLTLQLNQGGRYLRGGMQRQVQNSQGRSALYIMWNLEGLFLRQTAQPGEMEFACRLVNVVDGTVDFVKGISIPNGVGGFFLQIGNKFFEQRVPNGRYSDAILSAFDAGQRRSITASQQTPMHTRITARTTADAADLRIALDQYFSDSAGASAEAAAADELESDLQRIDRRLTSGQRPIAAALLRRVLSTMPPKTVKKSKITGNPFDLGNQTMLYWDLLLVVSIRQDLDLAAQLGMTQSQFQELQGALGADNFRYELTVQQNSFTAGEAFLTFGAGELDVTVRKLNSGGQLLETFHLHGFIGSWSPGVGIPVPISCAITTNTYTFTSPLNFQSADFAGPVDFAQFGVNAAVPPNSVMSLQLDLIKAAAGIDPSVNSWQIGYFSVYGSGAFPAMTFKTTPITGFQVNGCQLNVGVGVDIGGGKIVSSEPPDDQSVLFNPGQIVSFDASAHPALDGGVFFEINGSTLTDCGWQFLRTFVAEHHELLVGPKSKIRVEGHTDAAGGGAFNQTLSEARANSVKNALIGLLGPRLQVSITAIGKGETEHDAQLGLGPETTPAPNDPLFRRADIIVGGVVKAKIGAPVTPPQ